MTCVSEPWAPGLALTLSRTEAGCRVSCPCRSKALLCVDLGGHRAVS